MQHLTDELVNTKLEEIHRTWQRVRVGARRGILTEDEIRSELLSGFYGIFMGLFRENGLTLRLDKENYPCFAGEYEAYKKGDGVSAAAHLPWLFDTGADQGEAEEADRRQLFRLMEEFRVTPDYFEPPSYAEQIVVPDRVPIHGYNSACVTGTHFNCVDDGGLLADENPTGKTFTLTNDLGLKAVLTIKEDRRREDRNGMDMDELVWPTEKGLVILKAEFLAEGYIEGYTARERKENPEVLIRLKEGGTRIWWLAYWEDRYDQRSAGEYPMWQDYYRWLDEQRARAGKVLEVLRKEIWQIEA